ncbi:NDR1/HIN1-like protein 10 [Vicia villosa]|uniref:NDR1/HIN1-like protein 10 n=1 Tax=Vicia villosa TaxID=3911 RepID=UPI00273AB6AB|nr:NDR1/HIN1-like protein 10 [Vicia villosa]
MVELEAKNHNRSKRRSCYLLAIIIVVALIILILFLIIKPQTFKFSVHKAKLSQFNYTTKTNTLHYNLVLNFTARNPNKNLNIYYDDINGHVSYKGTRFASTDVITRLNSFRQYTNSTNLMSGVFSGQRRVVFDRDQVSGFEHDKKDGVFLIEVKLYFKIRFVLDGFNVGHNKGNIKCGLYVPFGSNGTKVINAFKPTKCDVNF